MTKDGRTIIGPRLNEDTFTLQLLTDQEQLITVQKSDLKEFTILKAASMPSYKDKLGPQQLSDVVAYLASLRAGGIEAVPVAVRADRLREQAPRKAEAGRERRQPPGR